jgi:hypothetical protein
MRTALFVTATILALHAGLRPVQADFVLQSGNPTPQGLPPVPPPGPGPVAPAPDPARTPAAAVTTTFRPGITATPLAPAAVTHTPINLLPQSSRAPLAHGFGDHVPLSFAVRQIVPANLHVAYANQVDPSALVTWEGGQPWNVALVHAVQPLRYRVWVSATTVHIYR